MAKDELNDFLLFGTDALNIYAWYMKEGHRELILRAG